MQKQPKHHLRVVSLLPSFGLGAMDASSTMYKPFSLLEEVEEGGFVSRLQNNKTVNKCYVGVAGRVCACRVLNRAHFVRGVD